MKIISWNVNGLRAVIVKGFADWLTEERPDILCLQEIKIDQAAIGLAKFDFPGYIEFYNPAERKGYSGTAILVRKDYLKSRAPEALEVGLLKNLPWDDEGRVQILDIGDFYLANVYFPNANHELSRLDFKIEFNGKLLKYFKKLEKTKPLVVAGDFNVAHNEIDLARPKENEGNPGFHPRERAWMNEFLSSGFIDTFRQLHPEKIQYSWWSYRAGARQKNVGWRIDYFCASESLIKGIKKSFILDDVMGSDHCPVGIELEI